jgi:hypothetical protein
VGDAPLAMELIPPNSVCARPIDYCMHILMWDSEQLTDHALSNSATIGMERTRRGVESWRKLSGTWEEIVADNFSGAMRPSLNAENLGWPEPG